MFVRRRPSWKAVPSRSYERQRASAMRVVEIDQLCVTDSERGHGYGRRLLAEIDAWARACGADHVELSVWLFNSDAIAIYERHGFVPQWQRMSRTL